MRIKRNLLHLCTILILIVAFMLCFVSLGREPLARWDEKTNAGVVKEMIQRGDPFKMTLDGKPFFEKPPLWYMITWLVSSAGGLHTYSFRFTGALSGFLLILFVYIITKNLSTQTGGIFAVLTLLATPHLFITNSGGFFSTHTIRSADMDILQILWITMSLYFFHLNLKGFRQGLLWGTLFSALAVLTKGPLGLAPFVLFWFYRIICLRQPIFSIKNQLMKALFFLLLLILPWYVYMYAMYGSNFLLSHFGYHIFQRITNPIEGHAHTWTYPLQVISDPQVYPLFPFFPVSIFYGIFYTRKRPEFPVFFSLSMILIILVLSIGMKTRLAWYVLPIYPFASILTGYMFGTFSGDREPRV